jgi:cytochrome P450
MDGTISKAVPEHVSKDRVFDFDIYADQRITDDVQGSLAAALAPAPDIFWTTLNGGHWIVRRYEMIGGIVKDPEHFSVREMQIPRVKNPPFFIPLSMDPPENLPYRQAMMPKFSPKAIKELEPRIREWAQKIVGAVAEKGECDFINDVSSLFPVSVFMELMGMPTTRLREFRGLAGDFFCAQGDSDVMDKLAAQILGMLGEFIAERRANPGNDLISHFISVDIGGRNMTDQEMLAMCFVLFLGGMDTVTNMTGFSYQYLAGDPALQARLAADPASIPKFVDEAIRCFSVINTPRLVIKDCERFGVKFKEGEMVLCMLAMGGRDDRVNADPNIFNIDRTGQTVMSFSAGPHLCVGHILARAEIRILTEEWFKRVPRFEAVPGVKHGFHLGTVVTIESLPLRWQAS